MGKHRTAVVRMKRNQSVRGVKRSRFSSARQMGRKFLMLQVQAYGHDEERQSMHLAAQSTAAGVSIGDTLAVARSTGRALASLEGKGEEAMSAAIASFRQERGDPEIQVLKRAIPELAHFPMSLTPTTDFMEVDVAIPSADDVFSAVSWATENTGRSGLGTQLQADWERQHGVLMESDCPAVTELPEYSQCFRIGFCVCSEDGQKVARRVVRFINHLKQVRPI